jgi:ubiquinone/menaquinone biosynthesis C-methylase UbiE
MSFDRLAPFYRTMELFTAGGKLQRCRLAFLPLVPVPERILLAGEGHGRFLPECLRRFPEAEIVVVDASRRMLEIAGSSVNTERVEFIHADFLEWSPMEGNFDLVVTNFFLDCFPEDELTKVIAKLGGLAAPNANWLLADFQISDGRATGLRSRVIVSLLYTFFRFVCDLKANSLISPDAMIRKEGFSILHRVTHEWGLLKSEWWQRPGRDSTVENTVTVPG